MGPAALFVVLTGLILAPVWGTPPAERARRGTPVGHPNGDLGVR